MTPHPYYRVLVVDDQAAVRSALKAMLSITDDMQCVREAADGATAIKVCKEVQPDLVLMDVLMPIMNGADATQAIVTQSPQIAVLALTSFLEPELVQGMMNAGVMGYLLKNVSADDLANTIRAACAGNAVFEPEAYKALFSPVAQPVPQATAHLID
jgi:two-component system, NarL family, response regulator LiaR